MEKPGDMGPPEGHQRPGPAAPEANGGAGGANGQPEVEPALSQQASSDSLAQWQQVWEQKKDTCRLTFSSQGVTAVPWNQVEVSETVPYPPPSSQRCSGPDAPSLYDGYEDQWAPDPQFLKELDSISHEGPLADDDLPVGRCSFDAPTRVAVPMAEAALLALAVPAGQGPARTAHNCSGSPAKRPRANPSDDSDDEAMLAAASAFEARAVVPVPPQCAPAGCGYSQADDSALQAAMAFQQSRGSTGSSGSSGAGALPPQALAQAAAAPPAPGPVGPLEASLVPLGPAPAIALGPYLLALGLAPQAASPGHAERALTTTAASFLPSVKLSAHCAEDYAGAVLRDLPPDVADRAKTLPPVVLDTVLRILMISPYLAAHAGEFVEEVAGSWPAVYQRASDLHRSMTPRRLLRLFVISAFDGTRTALAALKTALLVMQKEEPDLDIQVVAAWCYEADPHARRVASLLGSGQLGFPLVEKDDIGTLEVDLDQLPGEAGGLFWAALGGSPYDDTSVANQFSARCPQGKSMLHAQSFRQVFTWHRGLAKLAALLGYDRGVHIPELPKLSSKDDDAELTRMFGPAAVANSSLWGLATRSRHYRTSPGISPNIGPYYMPAVSDPDRHLFDRTRWAPTAAARSAGANRPVVLCRYWPMLLWKKLQGNSLTPFEQLTVESHRVAAPGRKERFAGPAFFIEQLGLAGTPLQYAPMLYPCMESVDLRDGFSPCEAVKYRSPCGEALLCQNCGQLCKVLGVGWELNQSSEVTCRVLHKAIRHWQALEGPEGFWTWKHPVHHCGPTCSKAPS